MSSEKLKNCLYDSADRKVFAADTIERIESLWGAFGALSSATIVQSTFVLPSERAFGNYEAQGRRSWYGAIFTEINYRLAAEARSAKNVPINDIDFLAASIGRRQWLDPRLWNMAKILVPAGAHAAPGAVLARHRPRRDRGFREVRRPRSGQHPVGGVIGDDGLKASRSGSSTKAEAFVGLQKFIRELKRRGIILAVVSKNEHANAILPFKEHPFMVLKEEDISAFVANWDNKADNIKAHSKPS